MNLEVFLGCNLLCNLAILWAAGRACLRRAAPARLLLAALMGAVYAAVSLGWVYWLQNALCKALCALWMACVGYGFRPWKGALRLGGMTAVMGLLLGGTGYGVFYLLGARGYGWTHFLLTLALGGAALCLLLPGRRARARGELHGVLSLEAEGGTVRVPAMLDTGNRLRYKGIPAVVLPENLAGGLHPEGSVRCRTVAGETRLPAGIARRAALDGRPLGQAAVVVSRTRRETALVPWELWRKEEER